MNPLMNVIGNNNNFGNLAQIKRMMKMIQGIQDPNAAIQMLAKQNPMIAQILSANNGDLKSTFYKMCEEKGVNPNEILNQLQN